MRLRKARHHHREWSCATTEQRIDNGCSEIVGKLRTVPDQEPDKVRPIRLRDAGQQPGCVGQNILRRQEPARWVGHEHGLQLPGQSVDNLGEAAVLSRLDVDASSLLGMANGQELRSCPRQQPARRQRLVLGPVDREAARRGRWREHRIDGRFRGKLHAVRGCHPGKECQTRDRYRRMALLVQHRQAAYPRPDAKPVRGHRISHEQRTRHESHGWHRDKEQP